MRKKRTIPESEGLTKVAESSKKGKGVKGGNQGIGMWGHKGGGCSEGPIEAKNKQLLEECRGGGIVKTNFGDSINEN